MTEEEIAAENARLEAERIENERAEAERLKKAKDIEITPEMQAVIDAQLKEIKDKLNKAYKLRDDAVAAQNKIEKEKRDAEVARLTEEGKHKEAYEIQLNEERTARKALEAKNEELSRNAEVRDAMSAYTPRNERASQLAFKEVVEQLVKNENGEWVHRSGITVKEFVESFAKDESNSFLFKQKTNSGGGSDTSTTTATKVNKSLFAMSQAEVLKLAEAGKLPKGR